MNFNDEFDWPERLRGFISKPNLADPKNARRESYLATMIYLEGAAKELYDQLDGRSSCGRDDLGWARLTRTIVVRRAKRVAEEYGLQKLQLGEGGFKYRWPAAGGMSDFFMCLVRYICAVPQWCRILDYGPHKSLEELSRVQRGEFDLSDLIYGIAIYDLKIRVRLATCWLFPLSLAVDAKWKAVASRACREVVEAYTERWVPVYEAGIKQLHVKLRPTENPKRLAVRIGATLSGYAGLIAGSEGESCVFSENGFELFARSVQCEIYSAIDPGDGCTVPEALNLLVHRPRDSRLIQPGQ